MLGGTGGTIIAKVNSRPLPLPVHSLNVGQGALATPGVQFDVELFQRGGCQFFLHQRRSFRSYNNAVK